MTSYVFDPNTIFFSLFEPRGGDRQQQVRKPRADKNPFFQFVRFFLKTFVFAEKIVRQVADE